MFASALAAITALEVVFFSKNDVAFGTVIKVLGIELFAEHFLVQALDGATYGFRFLNFGKFVF